MCVATTGLCWVERSTGGDGIGTHADCSSGTEGRWRNKPVAVFGMGPRRHEQEAFDRSRNQLERALAKVPEVKPVSAETFGGVDRERRLDVRDWGAIRAWAAEVASAFDAASAQEPSTDRS